MPTSFADAIFELGYQLSWRGPMPQTRADYQARARTNNGTPLPDWETIAPLIGSVRAKEVREEASRRLRALLNARDNAHLDILIANASREAIRLLRKGAGNWSVDEAARAAHLETADAAIEAILTASNTLEAMSPVPTDFAHDRWWP